MADIVLITGLSGAGRSAAAAVLEDLGWYVVDNLPTSLVDTIVELASKPGSDIERLALVSGRQHVDLLPKVAALRGEDHRVRIVFLDATTATVVKRYDSSRRKHPLDSEAGGLVEAIELERTLLDPVRSAADLVIDTSDLNIHQLEDEAAGRVRSGRRRPPAQIAIESFGYKYGMPLDADIIMDVRFLPNPHWEEELRPLTGHDPSVRDFVLERSNASQFLDQFEAMMVSLIPAYEAEGKTYLTIAMGCTGGRHRSVAVAEDLAARLRGAGDRCDDGPSRHRPLRGSIRSVRPEIASVLLNKERDSPLMTLRVGINGFGRIGRNFFRAAKKRGVDIDFVGVNDLGALEEMAHLLKYDSVLGTLPYAVKTHKDGISVGDDVLRVSPSVTRRTCRGASSASMSSSSRRATSTSVTAAAAHLVGGAPLVIVSAPCDGADATVVIGVNHDTSTSRRTRSSPTRSCTTNCFVPMVKILDDAFGVEQGLMTNGPRLHRRPEPGRRSAPRPPSGARAAINIIPTSTGAARATEPRADSR